MTWVFFALLKLIIGILIIAWQMLAKLILQTLLLQLFRISPVHLLHRCHYTLTVEYLHGPPHTLHTMPSMIQSWIFGCSEGPSRMFRRSQLNVPKVPVGCLEGPSWMFGSPRCLEVLVGRSEIGLSPHVYMTRTSSSWCFALLTCNSHTRPVQ